MSLVDSIFAGGVEGIFKGLRDVIGAFKADPTIVAQNAQKLAELEIAARKAELDAEIAFTQAQTRINEIEAASPDKFKSWWRPAAGWVCVVGFAYANIAQPLLAWLSANQGWKLPPLLESGELTTMLGALLGIGVYRSFDKLKGTARLG